ncbi:hypothetical protein BCR32DRAFT_243554 [Anaeromyces robustus]|uniref:Uncharacterized protein n=1 Tax=Anaeromyces robustus TaxID=1754192 RepID=A0A1Y1XBW4_9FUNG|nr:hypothetical protein BCR32DRAFT_243554 [Anaeromyces robustus]|eukprot:ORX83227.1 hypothetical protein BCR32DRAFT_243554 [Anaeromyces robustus]
MSANNSSHTENDAIGYKITGKELVDINFSISSMRNMDEQDIKEKYIKVFNEEKMLAIKWLFYARDCRNGIGERRIFRICLNYLSKNHPEITKAILEFIPEYGRWDDLLGLLKGNLKDDVFNLIKTQLEKDIENMENKKTISLCAKWMPSINTSSKSTKKLARILIHKFHYDERTYRKLLSQLRSYLKVIEVPMCAKQWDQINYSSVPSRANFIYKKAFIKNDHERRTEYLENLKKGKTKINADVLFPHDIVHKYGINGSYSDKKISIDDTIEELWKALPDYVQRNENTICIIDTSGSMNWCIPDSKITCIEVAYSLGIYFSERVTGKFKDKFITFSSSPELADFSNANNLLEKINIINQQCLCSNTNIEAVFNLILNYAIENNLPQEELPHNILILSDCEFDSIVDFGIYETNKNDLFVNMMKKYESKGYLLPRLAFWNIFSRSSIIPVEIDNMGVLLVNGFSPAIVKMVLSNKTNPFECLLEQLNSERYQPIEDALKDIIKT